jgi:glycerophosphoryl diester phosphodiesterase
MARLFSPERENMKNIECFGHRGAAGHEPENTLLSVKYGMALGADWIEVDVHAVDGRLAVIHDECLEKTTNGVGYVKTKSWDYLRLLDAGKGQQIPTLGEVIDCIDRRAGLVIEIKNHDAVSNVVSEIHSAVFGKGWSYRQFIVSSLNYLELQMLQCYDPHIRVALVLGGAPLEYAKFAEQMGAYYLFADKNDITPGLVEEAHIRGLKVIAQTVNSEEDYLFLEGIGVDGVISDFPDRIVSWRFLRYSETSLLALT